MAAGDALAASRVRALLARHRDGLADVCVSHPDFVVPCEAPGPGLAQWLAATMREDALDA